MAALLSVLSPAAIQQAFVKPFHPSVEAVREVGTGIGHSIGPQVKIAGGVVVFSEFEALTEQARQMLKERAGARGLVSGGAAYRLSNGKIRAQVRITQNHRAWDGIAALMNLEWFQFECADEYLSSDPDSPTVLTGQARGVIPAGTNISTLPGAPPGIPALPFAVRFVNDMRATGFIERDSFKGHLWYRTTYSLDLRSVPAQMRTFMQAAMDQAAHAMWGEFEVTFVAIPQAELPKHLRPEISAVSLK